MKISEVIKTLNLIKKRHGNLRVVFNETSLNSEVDPEYCIHGINGITQNKYYDHGDGKFFKAAILTVEE